MPRTGERGRGTKWLVLALVLAGASALRCIDLGRVGFWHDETYHALAARSMLESGEPVIPPGVRYDRAVLYTQCVAWSFEAFGSNEAAARLPSVLFNLAFLLIGFAVARRVLGFRGAAMFSVLVALSPLDVALSRCCRMYTLFELQYFIAVTSFFVGMEGRGRLVPRYPAWLAKWQRAWQVDVSFLLSSAVLLWLSVQSHASALNFGFVVLAYAVCRLVMTCWPGHAPEVRWKFLLVVVVCLAGAAVLWLFTPERIAELIHIARSGQVWDRNLEFPLSYYGAYLRDKYAFIFFLLPLGLFCLWFRNRSFAVFVCTNFAVLFVLHSALYFTKLPRYILYAMPFLLLAAAAALDVIVESLLGIGRRLTRDHGLGVRAAGIGVIAVTVAGFCYPMFLSARDAMSMRWYFDYKVFHHAVGRFIPRDAVIVSTEWEDFCWYFGREPDHYLRRVYPMMDRDTPKRISTDAQLQEVIATDRPVFLLTRRRRLGADDFMSQRTATLIADRFVEMGESGKIRCFVDKAHHDLELGRGGGRTETR